MAPYALRNLNFALVHRTGLGSKAMRGMFDETLRQLRRLERGVTITVALEPDGKGYLDRKCPNPECLYGFKVHEEDWTALFKDKAVFCPRCRHEAGSRSWITTEQLRHIQQAGARQIQSILGTALRQDATSFNARQPRSGFITMSMACSGGTPTIFNVPAAAREVLEQELQCEACSARFAVLGCAFFCPCCGHNSVDRTFDDALRRVVSNLDALPIIRQAMATLGKRDEAENTCNSLVESALGDCVAAFQVICEALHGRLPGAAIQPRNTFQRLAEGSELWRKAVGVGYDDLLGTPDFNRLAIYFQRRHLLAHTSGIVDENYLRRCGDTSYRLGQRVVVSPGDVRDAAALVEKLVNGLRAKMPGASSLRACESPRHGDGLP